MPIYEYQCTSCHHHFDLIQKISDEPEKQCPSCHQDTAMKLISAAGFQLKGNGWYVTDFKNKNSQAAPSTEKKAEKTTPEAVAKSSKATGKTE
ncbi:MAG: FmdB family transcriptional regulator [Legionella sp.]|nr:MAG: FmdB family transcriptional regulator [Legionella sp.]PJD99023.1 MAG: FmdB family transcriptional regulator [Legionella sp.]